FLQGLPIAVPNGKGALVSGPVNLVDYCQEITRDNKVPGCEPSPTTTTTTLTGKGGTQPNPGSN
ncbi:MAG TPA: hypothetical protein VGP46_11570, partial [Acidimicrobiales bacterium]|nr:hypothetical protein [Acidimicrobiales bacterium]